MNRLIVISLLLLGIQSRAQVTFFELTPGWRAVLPVENLDGYKLIGFTSTEPQQNHVIISELSLTGGLLNQSEFDFDAEVIRNFQFLQVNSHLSDLEFKASAGSIRFEETNELAGLIVRWNSDYSDTLSTYVIQLDSATSFRSIQKVDIDRLLLTAYVQEFSLDIYTSLLLLDTLGNIQWRQDFYCDDLPASICRLQPIHTLSCPDGGYLLTCRQVRTNNSCNFPVSSTLIKTDAQGNEQWRIRPGPHVDFYVEPGWPVLLDNGNVMFFWTDYLYDPPPADGCWQGNDSATVRFAEFELINGDLIQEGGYAEILPNVNNGIDYQWYFLSQAQLLSDGNILLSGGNLRDAFIAKVSQEGDLLWYRTHVPQEVLDEGLDINPVDTYIHGLIETSDGGFLGVGEFQVDPFSSDIWPDGFQTAFALKLDEYGCLEPGCEVVSIEEIDSEDEIYRIYPNPVSDVLHIQTSDRKVWDQIRISDILGRELINERIVNSVVDVSDLKTGLYVLTLYSKGLPIHSQKILKE